MSDVYDPDADEMQSDLESAKAALKAKAGRRIELFGKVTEQQLSVRPWVAATLEVTPGEVEEELMSVDETAATLENLLEDVAEASLTPASEAWRGKFLIKPADDALLIHTAHIAQPVVFRVHNAPTNELIEQVLDLRPDAKPLLDVWAKVWSRALTAEQWSHHSRRNEGPAWDLKNQATKAKQRGAREAAVAADDHPEDAPSMEDRNKALRLAADAYWIALGHEAHPGLRNWRLHAIDDAARTLALAEATPYWAAVVLNDQLFVYVGKDEEGLPILDIVEEAGASAAPSQVPALTSLQKARVERLYTRKTKSDSATVRTYWRSPAFQKLAGRSFFEAPHPDVAPFVLAEMAIQGCRKAFLKSFCSKEGTWTVDIAGATTPHAAAAAIALSAGRDADMAIVVQGHTPFVLEQRFFVVNGKVAASTASVRDLCALDGRPDRILDDRLARLLVPAGATGAYDRGSTEVVVDRAEAARCARRARQYARAAAHEGRLDYVIDIGITPDGRCLPIELNEFGLSGPYAVDHVRIVRAHQRRIDRHLSVVERVRAEIEVAIRKRVAKTGVVADEDEIELAVWRALGTHKPNWSPVMIDDTKVHICPPADHDAPGLDLKASVVQAVNDITGIQAAKTKVARAKR